MGTLELDRIRQIVMALPEVNERCSHGAPCFFIRNTLAFCYFHDNHRGDGRVTLWCPTTQAVQEALVAAEPYRFFKPPTSSAGTFTNWLSVSLESSPGSTLDWNQVAVLLKEVYCNIAPKRLAAKVHED
jgi:hypothetical protein